MQNFKELLLWQNAHEFSLKIYGATANYPKEEMFGVTSQLRRAVVSIPSNIAEGCGRHSAKDFAHFLQITLGSINESEYLLILSKDLQYLSYGQYEELNEKINKLRAMTIKLIEKVRSAL